MKTTIEYCTGIHSTGMPVMELRDIITELPEGYLECSPEDQERVVKSAHTLEVARAEAASRLNRAGADESVMAAWLAEHEDELFDAVREYAITFCQVYEAAAESLASL